MKAKRTGIGLYVLRDGKALPVRDFLRWAIEFERTDRQVALTELINVSPWRELDRTRIKEQIETRKRLGMSAGIEDIRFLGRKIVISTVFLGIDHNYGGGPPLLFETMVFNGPLEGEQRRYPDWTSAEAGHQETVERVRRAMDTAAQDGDRGVPVENGG